jgi:hypothetical protein
MIAAGQPIKKRRPPTIEPKTITATAWRGGEMSKEKKRNKISQYE